MIYAAIVVDDKDLMDFQKRFNDNLPTFKEGLLKGISGVMRNAIRRTLLENKIFSSGELYNSVMASKLGYEHYGVKMAGYAWAVERGSKKHGKPRGIPMSGRVLQWCSANGVDYWKLYRKIAMRGTEPHPFMAKSFMVAQPMLRAEIERRLNIYMKTEARNIGN